MNLTYSEEEEEFRTQARTWLAEHVPPQPLASMDTAQGFEEHRAWEADLNAGRWAAVGWPEEYGGRGADLIKWLIFEEEYYAAGAPGRVNQNGIFLLGPTLIELGTPEQKARFLPRMAAGLDIWAQAWSEPDAGSDLAGIRTSARLEGDHFVVNGQKTWASRAAFADWSFGLYRSDPKAERHQGLTFLLIPLDAPGVTVRPIAQLDGEAGFAEIFFEDVIVGLDSVLGEVNQGWSVAMSAAGFERGVSLRSPARYLATAQRLLDLFNAGGSSTTDAGLRRDVARVWMQAQTYDLYTYWTVTRLMEGDKISSEASLNKILWSELDLDMHALAMELLGSKAELSPTASDVVDGGRWLDGYLFSLAGPIYAGTNQIQRNVIADRVLHLPRAPRN